jgi:hypothetical protein
LLALGLIIQVVALVLRLPELAMFGLGVGGLADLSTSNERHPMRGRLRRLGLGLGQRVTVRALLMLGTVGASGGVTRAIDAYVMGICLSLLAARAYQRSYDKVLRQEPALGVANVGRTLGLAQYLAHARARRVVGIGALFGFEIPLALGLTLGLMAGTDGVLGYAIMASAASIQMGMVVAVAWSVHRFLRSDAVTAYRQELRSELEVLAPTVIVYFSGDRDATYQLNQWIPVFERLEQPILYVIRERTHLKQMLETKHPVLYARGHREVEDALAPSARVALYVANAGRNIHLLRYPQLKHVFLNHGDSDKASSANPFVRAYDKLFVAGEVAIERYRDGGVPIPEERFEIVGRPQLDDVLDQRRKVEGAPTTLLYAPTWEGYFEATNYSSLESMGLAMMEEILASHPEVRIVFKPHPMSGLVSGGMRLARKRVEELLRESDRRHVIASDHPDLDLLAWFDRADILLADVSAVVTDWLYTDKPYLLANPWGLAQDDFLDHFPSHVGAYLVSSKAPNLDAALSDALGADSLAAARSEMKRAVLGDHPSGPQASFERALINCART